MLGGDEQDGEDLFARLARDGTFNIVLCGRSARPIAVEARRLHYDHLLVTGTGGSDLSAAYTPVRTQLRAGGAAWILGAAGPIGQMHLLRVLSLPGQPRKVVATNLHAARTEPVRRHHQQLAAANGVALAVSPPINLPATMPLPPAWGRNAAAVDMTISSLWRRWQRHLSRRSPQLGTTA